MLHESLLAQSRAASMTSMASSSLSKEMAAPAFRAATGARAGGAAKADLARGYWAGWKAEAAPERRAIVTVAWVRVIMVWEECVEGA